MDSKEFEGMSRQEAAKFKAWFQNEHQALYPPPQKKELGLDWKFYGSIITSVATVLLAALRTAQMFYNAAELSTKTWGLEKGAGGFLSLADAFVSMLAVEAGLVVISAIKSTNKKNINENIFTWQITILLTISVIAGLGQSLGLVQNIDPSFLQAFSYVLSFVLGVGASFAAWFSGEVLGVLMNKFEEQRTGLETEFKNATEQYQKTARKFWNEKKEQERQEREKEKQEQKERERNENRESSGSRSSTEQNRERRTAAIPVRRTRNGISEKQAIILEEFDASPAGATELLGRLQEKYPTLGFASKGYISTTLSNFRPVDPESNN